MYICIYVYMYICICICICLCMCMCMCIYIYMCIYIWGFPYLLISLNQVMGFQTKRSRYFPRRWKNNDWHLRAVIRQWWRRQEQQPFYQQVGIVSMALGSGSIFSNPQNGYPKMRIHGGSIAIPMTWPIYPNGNSQQIRHVSKLRT